MADVLKDNAYHILGLDVTASQKDILKRSKEIISQLKIEEHPKYDLDLAPAATFRTEDSVKDALQRLQNPKKRIKEYFFWFQIADPADEQAAGLLKGGDYLNALRVWQSAAEGSSVKSYFYKKNLAILYCFLLSQKNDQQSLHDSIVAWRDVIESDKFWSLFGKAYELYDEQTANQEVVADFRDHVIGYLSDLYAELSKAHNDPSYLSEFQKLSSIKGEKVEKDVLRPAYQAINVAVDKLEKLKMNKDGYVDKEASEKFKECVNEVQTELNKLIDLGLYEDSETKIVRDRAAAAIRTLALELHNDLNEYDKALKLHEVAIQIAGTESLKNKLETEMGQIKENVAGDVNNTLALEIPGAFGGGVLVFKNNYLEYNNKRIFYKDAVSISYHSTNRSVNFIPVSQSFSYSVASEKEKISISFSTTLYIGNKAKKDVWVRVAGLSQKLIEPFIVKRLIDQIFDRGESVNIGGIVFSKEGYSRSKTFGGKESVSWNDTIYIPKFHAGNVIVWKDKDGKSRQFASVAMANPNAVILPELVQACYNRRPKAASL